MHATSLLDVLHLAPGVDVARSGGPGSASSVFIRGMNSEHTLILIDGVRLNDAMSPGRSFNYLDQISADAVEQVEVLRGPQGALFGSDGLGGVINIITRKGEEKPRIFAKVMAGSYHTIQEDAGVSGTVGKKLRVFLHSTRQDSGNFSAAGVRYGNHESDPFHNTTLTGNAQYQLLPNLNLGAFGTYSRARTGLDNFGGFGGDDPNYRFYNRMGIIGGNSRLQLWNNRFEQITRVSLTDENRKSLNGVDSAHPFDSERSTFHSKLFAFDVINNFYLHPFNTLTLGMNLQHEVGRSNSLFMSQFGPFNSHFGSQSATDIAFYAQDYINIKERLFSTLSVRNDHHNLFGNHVTYRAASTFPIRKTGTSFKASYGTGFKSPSLYQLYSSYGMPSLNPETSVGWDAGVEQSLLDKRFVLGATCFQNQLKDLIQFDNQTFRYNNIDKARTQGLEVYVNAQPFRNLSIHSSYTYTDSKNLLTGDPLVRRPHHKAALNINYQPHPKVNINLDIWHMGSRTDFDFSFFPAKTVKLTPFTRVDLAISYDIMRHVNIFVRMANMLDTPYELVKGYAAPRISAYGGLKMAL